MWILFCLSGAIFFHYSYYLVGKDGNFAEVLTHCRYELLFYPRYHLDQSSLLCRKSLLAKPIVMDVYEDYILVTYRPFDVHIFHVKLFGELTPSTTPDLQVKECFRCALMKIWLELSNDTIFLVDLCL